MAVRAIYYDTETTGVRPDKDRIIELAAYDPVRDLTFDRLINPGSPIPPSATAIHGISDEMVSSAPAFDVVFRDFIAFCEGDVVLIAHNNDGFDQPFLAAEAARNEIELPSWLYLDSLKWARRYRSDLPRHALQFLREVYGIAANNAHRALDDVVVLHQVFSYMIDDLPLETCLQLMSERRPTGPITAMPFGKHQGKPLNEVPKSYFSWLSQSGAFDRPENGALKETLVQLGLLTV